MVRLETGQPWHQPTGGGGRGHRDGHHLGHPILHVLYVPYRLMYPGEACSHAIGQDPPTVGQADSTVVPLKEGTSEPPLQLTDRVAYGRLAHLEFLGSAGEACVAGHDGEGRQPLDGGQVGVTSNINPFHGPMRVLLLYTE